MRTKIHFLTCLLALICIIQSVSAQRTFGPQIKCSHESCGIEPVFEDKFTYIPPREGFEFGGPREATISVTYNNFPANAQNAFQYAVDIWASYLESSVPITIVANYSSLGGSVLGFAGANDYEQNFGGAPLPNVLYPAALANKLAGTDLNPGTSDVSCTFNSNTNWYFGVDGNTPGGQFDFVSVVLHELGHGLGSIGGSSYSGGTGTYGFGGTPVIWDFFIENAGMANLSTFASPSTALGSQLVSNNLYWDGNQGVAGLSGTRPRIYAPSSWNGGSSYSHLNEGTYGAGSENSLMTPFIGSAEAIHDPGPAMLGMFVDMGWTLSTTCNLIGAQYVSNTSCDPVLGTFDLTINVLYENAPDVGFLSINGTNYPITSSPQEFTFTYPADGAQLSFDMFFTAEGGCTNLTPNLFTAPPVCCANLRFTDVDPNTEQFTVENMGSCTEDFSQYRVCSDLSYQTFISLTEITGDYTLAPGESLTLEWGSWNPDVSGTDLAIFIPFGDFSSPSDIRDYVQWGSAGNGGESIADAAGIWNPGDFITDIAPFSFIGSGSDYGVQFWDGVTPPCTINSVSAGAATGCNVSTGEYTQEILIDFVDPPGSGSLNVNGQLFALSSSPMSVILTGLSADGNDVDVTVFFTDNNSCTASESGLFTAPIACSCKQDYNMDGIVAIDDLLPLLEEFGCAAACTTDLTGDGAVTSEDVTVFLQFFGSNCP